MKFKLFRILTIILSFFFLTGFVPILSIVGPSVTALTSGNIYKAGAQFIVNLRIEKETGKKPYIFSSISNYGIDKLTKELFSICKPYEDK